MSPGFATSLRVASSRASTRDENYPTAPDAQMDSSTKCLRLSHGTLSECDEPCLSGGTVRLPRYVSRNRGQSPTTSRNQTACVRLSRTRKLCCLPDDPSFREDTCFSLHHTRRSPGRRAKKKNTYQWESMGETGEWSHYTTKGTMMYHQDQP